MDFSIFEENNYLSGASESTDIFPILSLGISVLAIYFSFRAIIISKKAEINHKKFDDLCLNPVKSELDRVLSHLTNHKTSLVKHQVQYISQSSRDFSMLLVRIREIYSGINVSEIQDQYNDFSDKCLNSPPQTLTESLLDEFQQLRVTILNHLYIKALDNLGFRKFLKLKLSK